MSPFPNQRVIHARYAEHHRPTAEDGMTSVCSVYPPASGPTPYKAAAGAAAEPIYSGPCNVEVAAGGGQAVQADQPQSIAAYIVTIPIDAVTELRVGERGHIIKVTESSDPGLTGRTFRGQSVEYGSNAFERVIRCTDNQTQN